MEFGAVDYISEEILVAKLFSLMQVFLQLKRRKKLKN